MITKNVFTCVYRSRGQKWDQFSDKDFSLLLNNINDHIPSSPVIVDGIQLIKIMRNAAGEALQIYEKTAGYNQLINKPTLCVNGSWSCINLVFTFNTNLETNFGADPTLSCHHNLILGNIHLPPSFYRDIWDYNFIVLM